MKQEHFKELFGQTKLTIPGVRALGKQRIIKADLLSSNKIDAMKKSATGAGEAQIEIKKNGDIIELIKVSCSCGRKIQIVLDYENKQSDGEKTKADGELS